MHSDSIMKMVYRGVQQSVGGGTSKNVNGFTKAVCTSYRGQAEETDCLFSQLLVDDLYGLRWTL